MATLLDRIVSDPEYASGLKRALKEIKQSHTRLAKTQKVLFNISVNRTYLMTTYTPAELLRLTDHEFGKHSALQVQKRKQKKELKDYYTLLKKDFLSSHVKGVNVIKCRRCGKGDINFTTKQTRSADEGMTSFCHCPHCDCRWKMS